jgi:enoyl-[acyl-carrier protein] reductase/trans-2-enoyl-CoA reductase (NAD+)
MLIEPRIRNNFCLNAHPIGCREQVRHQIRYALEHAPARGPRRVLVIGSSNGYGLAARIVAGFGCRAATYGVSFEKPPEPNRTATAGWYNERAFTQLARAEGLVAQGVNGDAFTVAVKDEILALVRAGGPLDLVVYSIAAPRRADPVTGELYTSALKPIGHRYVAKSVDFQSGKVTQVATEPANEQEVRHTVKVMGGEDWFLWMELLRDEGLLAQGALSVAFSYIGPEVTHQIYRNGTVGRAKEDLERTAATITRALESVGGRAVVSVNKALVTRASAVIPAVPLYTSLLYRVMKRKGLHEGCIEQMVRLYRDHLYADRPPVLDEAGRIRLDDWEMRPDVQSEVAELWERVTTENIGELADLEGFREEFLRHHGFAMASVDYALEVETDAIA